MRMKKLGNTGLVVSEVCLGTMTFSDGEGRWAAVGRMDQATVDDGVVPLAGRHRNPGSSARLPWREPQPRSCTYRW